VSYKTATSPVTQVDQASERKIIRLIRKRFPDHTFLAEESAFLKKGDLGKSRLGRYRWVIDPLDGTVNFMHRIPQACVSVAVECGGVVLAGGVYDPFRDELFLAARGKGATLNGKPIRVSRETKLIRALLVTGFPYNHQRNAVYHANLLVPFLTKTADIRRFGAAALDLAWIACGRLDIYWELGLQPWDVAAGWLLIEEAGGKVTDFENKSLSVDRPYKTLATNGRLHDRVVRLFS
jgi:myo-inositol-1(or 4)-monophosphatase